MFQLEAYSSTTPYVWAFDLTVVGVESLFFIPLSRLSLEAGIGFFYALALLLALDVAWILSMIPQWRRKSRPGVPMIWAVLNLLCILPIVLVVWFKPFDILSGLGLLLMTLMLWAVGLADVVTTAPKWFGKAAVHWEGSWRAQFRLL
jgi:predicted ABC-type exoprotein transport system permease subunit